MTASDPPVYVLSVRPPQSTSGGDVNPYRLFKPGAPLATLSPAALATFHRPLLLIHGFNDDLCFAELVYREMHDNLAKAGLFDGGDGPDVIIHFHWPGDVYVSILKVLGYAKDLGQCFQSASQLVRFWQDLVASTATVRVTTAITHSMGGRILLEALKTLAPIPEFDLVALMAAAVPMAIAQQGGSLAMTDAPPRQARKYYSSADMVLSQAFPAGQLEAWIMSIDGGPYGEAIGSYGDPVTFGIETKDWQLGHSDYWPSSEVAKDIAAAIAPVCRAGPAARPLPHRTLPSSPPPGKKTKCP